MRPFFKRAGFLGLILGAFFFAIACGGGGGSASVGTPVAVSISPTSARLQEGATLQFTATVTGTSNTAVTWSVNDVTGGNSTVGTVSTTGLFTAPGAIPSSNPVTVKATSQADTTKSASASVTIGNPLSAQTVTATAGQEMTNVNVNLATFSNPTLELLALGTCGATTCTAGSAGVELAQGSTATLFLVGNGVGSGTSLSVSGNSADAQISNIKPTTDTLGEPAVTFDIAISAGAPVGLRNLTVTNTSGEMAVFVGGIRIVAAGP
jgi:hypothetical protein